MSSSKSPRIKRGSPPERPLKQTKYRNALPELLRDFDGRCAYSMQHTARCGRLEVDHFDPGQKKDVIQSYKNLFPVSRLCNGAKSNHWPTKAEQAAGLRFLNPCEEQDYGEQILECPHTHELIPLTRAAQWHIRMCGLNAPLLIDERRSRAKHWASIRNKIIRVKKKEPQVLEMIQNYTNEVKLMIPEIKFATGGH